MSYDYNSFFLIMELDLYLNRKVNSESDFNENSIEINQICYKIKTITEQV